MVFPSQEVVLQLFAGGEAQGFPCQGLVKSPRLANYSSENIAGERGGQNRLGAFLLVSKRYSRVACL